MQINSLNLNFAYYGNPDSPPQQTFCDKVYLNYSIANEEIQEALLFSRAGLSPVQAQTESLFLAIFPAELQVHIIGFLEPRDLKACLFTCKQLNLVATPPFVKAALFSLSVDFAAFEQRINRHLTNIEPPRGNLNSRKVTLISPLIDKGILEAELKELGTRIKQISSFKAYCVFLINAKKELNSGHAKEDIAKEQDEEQSAMQKLASTLKLEKACKACSNEKEAKLKAMPSSLNGADLVVRSLIFPSLSQDMFFRKS